MSVFPLSTTGIVVGVGDRIAGRYRVERLLGRGGMGVVFAAVHEQLDERVAIKVLAPQFSAIASIRDRFSREARAAVKIKSEHAVRVTDVGALADGTPYIVMECLEGEDLAGLLSRRGKVSAPEAVLYTLQICDALRAAHSVGIVHGSLKPTNVFLARMRGKPPSLKVMDFGLSKAERHDRRSVGPLEVLITPWYMAPEQLKKTPNVNARSDIWSIGVLIHELVTGDVPFNGETLAEIIANVLESDPGFQNLPVGAAGLEPILQRCLAKNPKDRYRSIDELTAAIRFLEADEPPVRSEPPRLPSFASRPPPTVPSVPPGDVALEEIELIDERTAEAEADEVLSAEVELLPSMTPPTFGTSDDEEEEDTARVPDVEADAEAEAAAVSDAPTSLVQAKAAAASAAASASAPPPAAAAVAKDARRVDEPRAAASRKRWVPVVVAIVLIPVALVASRSSMRSDTTTNTTPTAANETAPPPSAAALPPSGSASNNVAEQDERPSIVAASATASSPARAVATAAPAETASSVAVRRPPSAASAASAASSSAAMTAPVAAAAAPAASGGEEDDATVGFRLARLNHETLRQTCWDASDKTTSVVTVTATVDPGGAVRTVSAATSDAKLGQCVEGQVRTWTFPASGSGSLRAIRIPIRFRH